MRVKLQVSNEYGGSGPIRGSIGEMLEIRKVDDGAGGEFMALVHFYNFSGTYWVVLENLMRADTSGTHTFWTTM